MKADTVLHVCYVYSRTASLPVKVKYNVTSPTVSKCITVGAFFMWNTKTRFKRKALMDATDKCD
jgi:hypothetical protein